MKREVSDDSAAFMAEACYGDPYYIAQTFESLCRFRDLTKRDTIEEILQYETSSKGDIAAMWMEYLLYAFARINDQNAKRIVLYLARYRSKERTRKQILEDLKLTMSDADLEKRLQKLVAADIIERGGTNYDFRGLGDPIFAMVFRKEYEKEIDGVKLTEIEDDLRTQLKSLEGKAANDKGIIAEYRLINRLLFLGLKQTSPQLVFAGAEQDFKLGPFSSLGKHSFHLDQVKRVEIDIYAKAKSEGDWDLIVEVKDHANQPSMSHIETFIRTRATLTKKLEKPTGFLFYSETGLGEAQETRLKEAGIMFSDGARLHAREGAVQSAGTET